MNFRSTRHLYCIGLLAVLVGAQWRAQAAGAEIQSTGELGSGIGPAEGARVAARGPAQVAVAWSVPEGPAEGVYLLQRNNFLWDATPLKLTTASGAQPRDLSILYDETDTIHLVWTALDQGRRRVFHASATRDSILWPARPISPETDADADYPLIGCFRGRAAIVIYQSSRLTYFAITSAVILPPGAEPAALPDVSGVSRSAMCPQLVKDDPPLVGYYEILESGSELRFAGFDPGIRGWQRTGPLGVNPQLLHRDSPVVVSDSGVPPYACWVDESAPASLRVERRVAFDSETMVVQSLQTPSGDPSHPHLAAKGDWLTVCWQAFAEGRQTIGFAGVDWSEGAKESLVVSIADHRFASDPWHASEKD